MEITKRGSDRERVVDPSELGISLKSQKRIEQIKGGRSFLKGLYYGGGESRP